MIGRLFSWRTARRSSALRPRISVSIGVERGDALERLAGDRRRAGGGEFVEAPADMRPAEGELHLAALGERRDSRHSRRPAARP